MSAQIGQAFGMMLVSNGLLASVQFLLAPIAARLLRAAGDCRHPRVQAVIFLTMPFSRCHPSCWRANSISATGADLADMRRVWLCGRAVPRLDDYGVWALVWAPIATFVARAIGLSLAWGKLIRPVFDFRGAGNMLGFGATLTCARCAGSSRASPTS